MVVKKYIILFILCFSSCSNLGRRGPNSIQNCRKLTNQFFGNHYKTIKKRISRDYPKTNIFEVVGDDLVTIEKGQRELLEEKRLLYYKHLKLKKRFPNDPLVQKYLDHSQEEFVSAKKNLGKAVINSSFIESAIQLDEVILTRAINSGAHKYIGHKAALKPTAIKAKTANYGLIKGLIPVDQNLSRKNLSDAKLEKYKRFLEDALESGAAHKEVFKTSDGTAVLREGIQVFTNDVRNSDQIIEVLVDSEGNKFTADMDLFSIARRERDVQTPFESEKFGITTQKEISSIKKINRIFKRYDIHRSSEREIVLHGSETYNPHPENIDFPIRAYTPDGRVFNIESGPRQDPERNLRRFKSWINDQGYFFP